MSLFFADRAIFNEIAFIINKQDRIGLVGKNGAGKSTMLKALAGIQKIDSGNISYPSDITIGYLPQDMDFESGRTVLDETKTVFSEIHKIQHAIEDINHQLAVREDYESDDYLSLLDQLSDLNERLNLHDVDNMDSSTEKILLGLGFTRKDFERKTEEFSGGWRMRIELAKILLKQADLLLLDEPTNHLDIESIQWLEGFLSNYPGAIVLISHDRAFLDNLTKRTIEISLGKIYDYAAPYTKYLELRKERREQEIAAYENQQKQIKETEEFIDRFRAKATKAVQVQSRIKQLNRLERIEIDIEDNSAMRFHFPPAPRSGKVVIEAEDLAKSYGEKQVFSHVDFMVERGEKIAFVGKNGEGKSTMSRLLTHSEKPSNGKVKIGHQVQIGYYAQNQADVLDKNKTVFETIDDAAKGEARTKVRTLLGSFLFSGDEVDKYVKVLSGGERARLAMCKLLLEPINLLILDEPTNHLDIRSKDILKEALKDYDGSLIVISHDRDFLQGLTSKVFEFGGGKVKEHIGDIYDFLKNKKVESFREWEKPTSLKAGNKDKAAQKNGEKSEDKSSENIFQIRKELKKECKQFKNKIANLEKEISSLEEKVDEIQNLLKDPNAYIDPKNQTLIKDWEENSKKLELKMMEWEKAAADLEEKEQELAKLD